MLPSVNKKFMVNLMLNAYILRLITTLPLIFTVFTVFTQTNNFAPIGATWHYHDIYGIDFDDTVYITGYNKIVCEIDTLIEGITCRKLHSSYFDPGGYLDQEKFYYTYESDGKVYFYVDGKFVLLYNFTGENWYAHDVFYGSGDSVLITVDSVVFELYDGSLLKTLYIQSDITSSLLFPSNKLVEKIGPFCYLFLRNGGDDSFPPSGLRCYEDDEISYYVNESYACDSLTPEVTDIEVMHSAPFTITYNGYELSIIGICSDANLFIFNTQGQIIKEFKSSVDIHLNLETFPSGNYVLSLQSSNKNYSHKIVIL